MRGPFLVESFKCSRCSDPDDEKDVRALSEILGAARRAEGIFDFVGYTEDPRKDHFILIFALPTTLKFRGTLRELLKDLKTPPLDARVNICAQLANAVLHVHSLDVVHKNIKSAEILMMVPKELPAADDHRYDMVVFLANWQMVRKSGDASSYHGETLWWRGIYQHPSRQTKHSEAFYSLRHDIYSLGVCTLEILLWKSLVEHNESNAPVIA